MSAEALRKMREEAGLSQWAVARALGRTGPWLSLIELGYSRPREDDLFKIGLAIEKLKSGKLEAVCNP